MIREKKPMLDVEGQIRHLQSKGVQFNRMSVDEATEYLHKNNNYFKLCAYRKNFPKHPGGSREGQYINLDFAFLKDLSIIDMLMRYTFIQMALDVEHFAKVKLLRIVENSDDDGYQIVEDFLNDLKYNNASSYSRLLTSLENNKNNPYCGGIIRTYENCYPIWAFIEIVPFGTMMYFYGFCSDLFYDSSLIDDFHLLKDINQLRNATAHSNCLIHQMGEKDSLHKPNYGMLRALSEISKTKRKSQLKNERLRQMITLLYAHTKLVKSEGVQHHTQCKLNSLVTRMYQNIEYYEANDTILASFSFFREVVDIFFG